MGIQLPQGQERGNLLMRQVPMNRKKMNMGILSQQQQQQNGNFKKKDEDDVGDEEIREIDL